MDLASRDDGKEGERVRDGGIGSTMAGINASGTSQLYLRSMSVLSGIEPEVPSIPTGYQINLRATRKKATAVQAIHETGSAYTWTPSSS